MVIVYLIPVRRIKIILACFNFIAVPSLVATMVTAFFLWTSGTTLFLLPVCWTKLITTGLLLLFVRLFRNSRFYFFNNLGCSTYAIYGNMVLVDFLIALASFSWVLFFL